MLFSQKSSSKNIQQHLWASLLLAILTVSSYTLSFFSFSVYPGASHPIFFTQYLVSITFMLIMILLISVSTRAHRERESKLISVQQDYFDLLQQAADPMIVLNKFGVIVSVNPAAEQMFGYKIEGFINKHFLKTNLLIGHSAAIATREFLQILNGEARQPFELSFLHKSGHALIVEAHARRIQDVKGNHAVHIILRDITNRKSTEEILINERNNAQNYLNIAGVMILTFDRNGIVTLINKKGCEILGYSENKIIGQNWFKKFVPPEDMESIQDFFNRMYEQQSSLPQTKESNVLTRSRTKKRISWTHSLIRDTDNTAIGTLSSGEDITEKRLNEDKLYLQSAALEAAANAILITDKAGTIVWTNPAFQELTGYSLNEAVGQSPKILKSGLHNERFYENLWQAIVSGKTWQGEIVNRRKDDRLYTEEMTITPVRDREGDIQHYIAIKQDITERRRLRQNLEQANLELEANSRKLERTLNHIAAQNKVLQETQNQLIQSEKMAAIGVLSSGIAHEIKNPLAVILLSIDEFIAKAHVLDDQSKKYIEMIKNAADRANNVIIELLRFARVSDLRIETIVLSELISATFLLVQNNATVKGVTLTHQSDDDTISFPGDRILLEQVLFNLLMNALDSTERGGSVTVKSSSNQGSEVVLKIQDTGNGIAEENLSKIFEPFFTTKEQGKGTGLGLSTVYTILKRHRGKIEVQSIVGAGTIFTITLPITTK